MKNILRIAVAVVAGLGSGTGSVFGQGAVRTDTAGNPVTSFNLGGSNVTGTLAAERLPSAARPPVVQTITQTSGSVTLGPGTNVAVLGAALTGALDVTLPAVGSYPAGRAFVIVDPGGYSSEDAPVRVAPAAGNTLNGAAGLLVVLTDSGSAGFFPSGSSHWTTGQSGLLAPSRRGLVVRSPGTAPTDVLLRVQNGDDATTLSLQGDGTIYGATVNLYGSFYSDDGEVGTDGTGTLNAGLMTSPEFCFSSATPPEYVTASVDQAVLYFSTDGRVHCRTPDGADHVLSWTTP